MSTRGFYGFAIDDELKIAYSATDSFPGSLGDALLRWTRDHVVTTPAGAVLDPAVVERVRALVLVDENDRVPGAQRIALARYAHDTCGTEGTWYRTLRGCQGDLGATLDAGYMADAASFPLDSLYCEWGYLLELNDRTFDVYRGNQRRRPTDGRWTDAAPLNYATGTWWPVQRVWRVAFDELTTPADAGRALTTLSELALR